MEPFMAVVQPLCVQRRIHLRCQRRLLALRLRPGRTKCLSVLASAEKTGAMTCGERDRLIEKEKLGPATAVHYVPLPPLVVENANQPRFGRPAFPEQRLCCRVMDDPAITCEKPPLRYRDDLAERCHPVLQRSATAAHHVPTVVRGRVAANALLRQCTLAAQ